MKSILLILVISIFCVLNMLPFNDSDCGIFEKNDKQRDTIVFKAKYVNLVKMWGSSYKPLLYLQEKGFLEAQDFKSNIVVNIANCDKEYDLLGGKIDKEGEAILNNELQQELLFTCVIFRDKNIPDLQGKPLVIVTKVSKL